MRRLEIYDTTLRDGVQGEGIAFSLSDKLKIVRALAALGIPAIEAGAPASNPKDMELFHRLEEESLPVRIHAFGSTRRKNTRPEEDAGLAALCAAHTPYLTVFGKSSRTQAETVLETTPAENLAMISDTVAYLTAQGKTVVYDAEHFFDAWAEDADYALETLKMAASAGARTLCLCDTRGATYPCDIAEIVSAVAGALPGLTIGIHTHNDCGLAVAGAMFAADAGATQIQGTYLGFGERCGNANLSTLIANLQLKRGYECIPAANMPLLTPTAIRIADLANYSLRGQMPYVGRSAFSHKAGMHVDGVLKAPPSFEHIAPETVGNKRRFLLSEVAGRSALLSRIQAVAPHIRRDSPEVGRILDRLKALEYRGYQFEAAQESFALVVRRALGMQKTYYTLEYFKILGEQPLFNKLYPSSAMVKVRVQDATEIAAAEGNGPVHAIDLALRKCLSRFYPCLSEVRLTDYKVRVLESDATTAATVRVLIESTDGQHSWATVGVSTDIIEASFLALSDSIEYKLTLDNPGGA